MSLTARAPSSVATSSAVLLLSLMDLTRLNILVLHLLNDMWVLIKNDSGLCFKEMTQI